MDRTVTESKQTRAIKIAAAKLRSEKTKSRVRLTLGDEHFIFENGSLVEFDYALPDYLEV